MRQQLEHLNGKLLIVLGPMGIGKSSLLKAAENEVGAKIFPELVPDNNPFFLAFYQALVAGETPNPAVLDSQLTFLAASASQAQEIFDHQQQNPDQLILWEMSIYGHFMYAWLQQSGEVPIMSPEHWQQYLDAFQKHQDDILRLGLVAHALLVLTVGSSQELMVRIDKRARNGEAGVPLSYVDAQFQYWQERLNKSELVPGNRINGIQLRTADTTAAMLPIDAQHHDWTNDDPTAFAASMQPVLELFER